MYDTMLVAPARRLPRLIDQWSDTRFAEMKRLDGASFREAISVDRVQAEAFDRFVSNGETMPLWSRWGRIGNGPSGSTYSCLIAAARAAALLGSPSWDGRLDGFRPGFSESYSKGGRRVSYEPLGADGVEALVHIRFPLEDFPLDVLVTEELVLLFDLHRGKDRHWYRLDEAGTEHLVIEIHDTEVLADRGLIRRYQAVKQMSVELMIDSDLVEESLAEFGELRLDLKTSDACFSYVRAPLEGKTRWFSRLLGKRLLAPPAVADCGLWPYEPSETYENFIIGVDDVGRPIQYSSDPDGLGNYFGANPDAPNYVTPIAFRKDVLEKYYRAPAKYTVEDGYLRRRGFWGIRIDNEHPDYVTVMLGDLGRDLPFAEQKYWKSFNLPRKGRFSETAFRRGFLAQFAEAAALDVQFRRIYRETNDAWRSRYNWTLFLALEQDDADLLDQVRILPSDDQHAFDEQVLGLAKLLIDSLNEVEIVAAASSGAEDEKGISKLARFLAVNQFPDPDLVLDHLRGLQAIRSSGAAHRKGRRFEKLRAAATSDDRRLWWADLLERSIKVLEALRAFARANQSALRQ